MIPPSVQKLVYHHPDDATDTYRLKEHKNHPFLSNIKIEFAPGRQGSSASTYIHWIQQPRVSPNVFRIRNSYDEKGNDRFIFSYVKVLIIH